MSGDVEVSEPALESEADPNSAVESLVSETMQAALKLAQDRLLDRSLRNKLINTPLKSTKARQVRIYDELSDQVFARLRSKGAFTFTAGRASGKADEEDEAGSTWVPDEEPNSDRHTDTKLQTQLTPEGLQKRLLSLYYEGKTLEEEQGINVLYLALGFLEWREAAKSEIERFAPLVLLPVELLRDGARDRFKLTLRDEDLITNISLQAWLKDEFGIQLPDVPEADDWSPTGYFQAVTRAIEGLKDWRVHTNETLLGFFSFSKFLLWRDLNPENWSEGALLNNELLKQLLLRDFGGDELIDSPLIGEDQRIDQVFRPAELIHITDADSSQAEAIQEVMAGKNLVIQGPPGTGKSQTITNIIAGAVAKGKSVLFVAEKMAALDVVHERLSDAKLRPICLELHSRKSSKTSVREQLKEGRNTAAPPNWSESAFAELEETQQRLRAHSDVLHAKDPTGFSPFALMGEIGLLKGCGAPTPSFALSAAVDWPANRVQEIRRKAQSLADQLLASGVPALHPWRGVGIAAPDVLTRDRIRPVISNCLTASRSLCDRISALQTVLDASEPITLKSCERWADALDVLAARPEGFDEIVAGGGWRTVLKLISTTADNGLRLEIAEAAAASAFRPSAAQEDWTATRLAIAGHGASIFRFLSGDYRNAVARLRGHWNGALPKGRRERLEKLDALIESLQLRTEVTAADAQLRPVLGSEWKGLGTDWARLAELGEWLRKLTHREEALGAPLSDRLPDRHQATTLAGELRASGATTESAFADAITALDLDLRLAFEQPDLHIVADHSHAVERYVRDARRLDSGEGWIELAAGAGMSDFRR
jgi:hypothetical protein